MKSKKIIVIFDGGNFYHLAKRISPKTHLTCFNYRKFCEKLVGQKQGLKIEYCVGEIRLNPRDKKSQQLFSGQQALFENLRKQDIIIKLGFMLNVKGKWTEKGVDVRIAVDILRGAFKHEYDICYIISSDSDLIPAISDAKTTKAEIIYVGFENFVSLAMKNNCSKHIFLKKEDIERSFL